MDGLMRLVTAAVSHRASLIELAGMGLATTGIHEVYPPAALVFVGAALACIAQGMERGE